VYDTPDYTFLSSYMYQNRTKEELLSDFEIYNKVYGHPPTAAERQAIIRELNILVKKYNYHDRYNTYDEVTFDVNDTPLEVQEKRSRLSNLENTVSNITEKKYRWRDNNTQVFIRVFFYLTLGITLLIFIFRHTSVRTFFLSALAGVLLTIITAMVLGFSNADDVYLFGCMIVYIFFFFFGTLAVWKARKRNAVTGIMINLFTLIVTALPILIMVWYYEYERNKLFKPETYKEPFDIERYAIYAEVGGALLLLVLLATYISKLYRRWFALPED
jgi:hypothetical protein